MMRSRRLLALGSLVAVAGCGGCHAQPPAAVAPPVVVGPRGALDAGVASAPALDGGVVVAPVVSASHGVPHLASIVAVAIARHADAALSIDVTGEIRLWTALDGTAAPRRLALTGVLDPRIERAGDGIMVGAVLPGGVGYIGVHHPDGAAATEVVLDSLDGDVIAVVPTLAAGAVVVARADQVLELYDRDGTRQDRVELGRERLRGLVAIGPTAVLAVLRRADDRFVARRYQVRGDRLVATADVALPHEPLDGKALAVSPDGTRLASFRLVAVAAPPPRSPSPPAGPGKPVALDRMPVVPPAVPAITVQLVDLATGADVTPAALRDHVFNDPDRLGFAAAAVLVVNDGAGGIVTAPVIGAGPLNTTVASGQGVLAVGDGVVLGASGSTLAVQPVGGLPVYLGYRLTTTRGFALSPDGHQLAVVGFDQALAVEALDGSAPERVVDLPGARPTFVGFLDEHRLLVVDEDHRVTVRDATTGAEQAALIGPAAGSIALHPRRSWLFGQRAGGGLWAVPLDLAGPSPFGSPISIDDDSGFLAVIDDGRVDGPVVATLVGDRLRTYTAADLRAIAAATKKRAPGVRIPPSGPGDEVGHFYNTRGNTVVVTSITGASAEISLGAAVRQMVPMPAGGALVAAGAAGGFTAYGLDGTPRWSLALGSSVNATAASADRGLLGLSTQGGILVVDAASGEARHASCGWGFGAFSSPPPELTTSQLVLCR